MKKQADTFFDRKAEMATLQAELADAKKRYVEADAEGRHELNRQMRQTKRDILRNTEQIKGEKDELPTQ